MTASATHLGLATAGLLLTLALPRGLAAQDGSDCDTSTPTEGVRAVWPADGASDATVNTVVRVDYGADLDALPATDARLVLNDSDALPVPGRIERQGSALIFIPATELDPGRAFQIVAQTRNQPFRATFRTQSTRDTSPPAFVGPLQISSSASACDDFAFRLALSFPPARDDGPAASIEYLAYVSAAAGLDAPVLRTRTRNFPTDRLTMAVPLTRDEAESSVCVEVRAIDGLGQISTSRLRGCFDPIDEQYFNDACNLGRARGLPLWLIAPAWLVRRRRKHRKM